MIKSQSQPSRNESERATKKASSNYRWRMVIAKCFVPVMVLTALIAFSVSIPSSWSFGMTLDASDGHEHAQTIEYDDFQDTLVLAERVYPGIRKYASSSAKFNSVDPKNDNKKVLNVHVVPHTHDDVGWLKTVEQYYNGLNNTIQVVSVREILTSVVQALEANPSRTFTYVEMKFFTMWWKEQPESVRERVRRLVQETKQLTFANGGWCMHDEAATHFMGMIDQTTLGHSFLKETFDYVPTVGWQLDPFGHSSTQSSLMTYKTGFDALFFGRIDYQDMELRHATKECEGLWNAGDSDSYGEGSIFWGLTGSYGGNYGAPGGYCLDVNCGEGQKSFIDKNHTALVAMIQDFLLAVRQQSDRTKGDHLMITMGSDFQYQRAAVNFANLDLLIGTIMDLQKDGTTVIPDIFGPKYDAVNIFYSSPEYYTSCKYNETLRHRSGETDNERNANGGSGSPNHLRKQLDANSKISSKFGHRKIEQATSAIQWSVKRDDFFPYSDCSNCFWTGYFTSRPSLKRFERVASSFLLAARQIESTLYPSSQDNESSTELEGCACKDPIYQLEDAVGVMQHHDGVSGTSKQHVAYDYAKTVQAGINAVIPCTIRKLKRILLGDGNEEKFLKDLTYCQLLNETKCQVSVDATLEGEGDNVKDLYLIVYNSLATSRSAVIDLPVGSSGKYLVEDLNGGSAETLDASPMKFRSTSKHTDEESFVLSFVAEYLPAVGAKVFRIKKHDQSITMLLDERELDSSFDDNGHEEKKSEDGMVEISNGHFSVLVDTKTGGIRRVGAQEVENLSSWGYYTSYDEDKDAIRGGDNHNSGAYIFRPSTPYQELQIVPTKNASVFHSSTGTEIHTQFEEPWIQTTTRIQKGLPFIEIEYQVGPIPIDDGRGKEVVTRYNTNVNNDAVFYTDSNGREFIRRQRNHRPTWDLTVFEPIAGNYYPINAAIYVEEEGASDGIKSGSSFAVVTDRSQGGGSIFDGTIELMVHRRTLRDDYRGVDEPINETDVGITPCHPYGNATRIGKGLVIRGKHRILVEKTDCENESICDVVGGELLARSVMDSSFADPLVFVASSSPEEVPFRTKSYSSLTEELPKNIMLITKRLLHSKESKSYLVRLGHQYGEPAQVDLSSLFPQESIEEITEMTLSANRNVDDWKKERFKWNDYESKRMAKMEANFRDGGSNTVELESLDIRTWIVKMK